MSTTTKTIEITVSIKGDVKVETIGFVGNECREATNRLELALGAHQFESLKSEFYLQAPSELHQNAKP